MARICLLLLALPVWLTAAEITEIKNMHAVNDHIYRGAQPDGEGFKALAKMGIKMVIDLRDKLVQADQEKRLVESLGMQYLSVPMNMHAPTDDQIAKVLGVLNSNASGPVFIHCLGGKDRTGVAIACYRIAHDGWDNRKALAEARVHGLSMFDIGLRHYVERYHPPTSTSNGSK
jgi:protein tyrosine/serine phosphatase